MRKGSRKLRLLVADDHELVRRGIRSLLEANGGWVVVGEAVNGVEAVQKARSLKPDVAILDITMPEMDGLEAAREIRKAVASTQVLVLTMHESDQMVRRVLEAGARGYILKSDLGARLAKGVRQISRGKLYLTPKVSEIVLDGFLKASKKYGPCAEDKPIPTAREAEIIRLLAKGKSNKEIAEILGITVRTVETHRAKIMLKLGLHSIVELVNYASGQRMEGA